MQSSNPVLIIGGPTASGKSGLALGVADARNGVIINADSMQLYDGLPMLSAQPSALDQAQAPHALYGVIAPDTKASAASWRDMALAEIEKALHKNQLPIVTGGTGFYIKTLTDGISPIPEFSPDIRVRLSAWQQQIGTAAFYEELKMRDPVMAAKLDPHNTQRLIRAMEVLEGTGQSLAIWQDLPRIAPPAHLKFITAALLPPRDILYRNCDQRFAARVDNGALDEAQEFKTRVENGTVPAEATLTHALGYPELCDYIDGNLGKDEAIRLAQQSTRNYAKRQTTWFSNQTKNDIVLENSNISELLQIL